MLCLDGVYVYCTYLYLSPKQGAYEDIYVLTDGMLTDSLVE